MRFIATLALCLGLFVVSPLGFAQAAQDEIIINGSTTVLPVMQKGGEAFMAANPDISLAISGGGSGNGIKALNEGLCAVAMSSRDIKDSEKAEAEKMGIKPYRTAIAVDALVPVVNPNNPVKGLSAEQLREIYKGNIKNWKEVGGNDEKIVVISRDTSSGTYESWEEIIMKKEKVSPTALMQASNVGVVQAVSNNNKAIGYIGFGYLNSSLKKLDVNNIEATPETALAGEWPIARELYLFTDGEPKGAVKKLVDFMLDPMKGQKSVAEVGYIPLKK